MKRLLGARPLDTRPFHVDLGCCTTGRVEYHLGWTEAAPVSGALRGGVGHAGECLAGIDPELPRLLTTGELWCPRPNLGARPRNVHHEGP